MNDLYLFLTLTLLEIILGVDNIVFLTIISNQLPAQQRASARFFGLTFALGLRIIFLTLASHLSQLKTPLALGVSVHDLIFLIGGGYLFIKSLSELKKEVYPQEWPVPRRWEKKVPKEAPSYLGAIIRMGLVDIIFSIDTVMTAVGMTTHLLTIISAIVISIGFMLFFAQTIAYFIEKNVRLKRLALCFLTIIGAILIAEGLNIEFDKAYLYAAVGFSLFVEVINVLGEFSQASRSQK